MATEIRVPTLGESVSEATIGRWFKKAGDTVKADEPICELETDKVTLEVNAPAAGVLSEIAVKDGETVTPGALLGQISADGAVAAPKAEGKAAPKKDAAKAEAAKSAAPRSQGVETGAGYGNHADPAPSVGGVGRGRYRHQGADPGRIGQRGYRREVVQEARRHREGR